MLTGGKLAGVDEVNQYALQRRALLPEVKRLTREVQIAEGQLGMARTDSWIKVTRALTASVSNLKAQLATAQQQLVAFDKDLGND